MSGWSAWARFLQTDPSDVGCGGAMEVMHVYAELAVGSEQTAAERYPGVATHLRICDPCAEDLAGLMTLIRANGHGPGQI
ncbi:MAG: hypothetical protein JO016_14480 [Actinobacteria bacterium]|nr:hypothetical protein [Actinomycetota bacterium]